MKVLMVLLLWKRPSSKNKLKNEKCQPLVNIVEDCQGINQAFKSLS